MINLPSITAVLIFVRDHIDTKPAANQQNRSVLSPDKIPFSRCGPAVQKPARQVMFSLTEAAFIQEGDRVLLWLAAFLAILLFAVSS